MKSLSTLLLISLASALIIGALLAVTPAAAGDSFAASHWNNPGRVDTMAQQPAADTSLDTEAVAPVSVESLDASLEVQPASVETNLYEPEQVSLLSAATYTESTAFTDAAFSQELQKESIPETGLETEIQGNAEQSVQVVAQPSMLTSFVESVTTGQESRITGIYADQVFALRVSPQPNGDPEYITNQFGEVTQFSLASAYGSLGFLAHNYLSGYNFYTLSVGQIVTAVYGDGTTRDYQIQEHHRFQALEPDSSYSSFIDLQSGDQLTYSQLFNRMYTHYDTLVLQTCIANNGISTWGRLFIIATPVLN